MPIAGKWQLQDGRNRLSEVVRRARDAGPQTITLRGDFADVVLAAEAHRQLARRLRGDLAGCFRRSPPAGVLVDLSPSPDPGRDVDLTRNAADFERYCVRHVNPWDPAGCVAHQAHEAQCMCAADIGRSEGGGRMPGCAPNMPCLRA